MENKKKYVIELNQETVDFIEKLVNYENFKRRVKTGKLMITEEDIIKAAINDYLDNIQNYYKKHIIESKQHLSEPIKLQNRFMKIMKKQGLRQTDLVEISGIDKANMSNILNNKQQPGMDYFLRLWISLDYPKIEDIFYRKT